MRKNLKEAIARYEMVKTETARLEGTIGVLQQFVDLGADIVELNTSDSQEVICKLPNLQSQEPEKK